MTASPRDFVDLAHSLLADDDREELATGPLYASASARGTWTVWYVDGEQSIYLDTVRPELWASAAELNVHLQTLAPVDADGVANGEAGPEPPAGAFQ